MICCVALLSSDPWGFKRYRSYIIIIATIIIIIAHSFQMAIIVVLVTLTLIFPLVSFNSSSQP